MFVDINTRERGLISSNKSNFHLQYFNIYACSFQGYCIFPAKMFAASLWLHAA